MKIRFEKRGLVYKPEGNFPWGLTHAQVPFPLELANGTIRIFFATRDAQSRSSVAFIDVDKADPRKVLYVHDKPCFSAGAPGTFDDSGTMPSWFMRDGNRILLYYTAWNKSETASYRLSIGVAASDDEGLTFKRLFPGPVLDRGPYDPIWVGQPCIMRENELWRMWYLSCEKIQYIHNHPEPFYNVKYAESTDGINWKRENKICVPFDANTDAVGRPFVWKQDGKYFMLHSNRKADGYRSEKAAGYRIELSVSSDGISWMNTGNTVAKSEEGWDTIMNEYTAVLPADDKSFWVFYNGNNFGGTGFGLARLTFEQA